MNKWIARVVLLGLLLSSVSIKIALGDNTGVQASLQETLFDFMASRGFAYRGATHIEGGAIVARNFDVPHCSRPLEIAITDRTFQAMSLFDRVGQAGDFQIFVYLDTVLHRIDRHAMFLEHAEKRALQLLGMTSYVPDTLMLMISEPNGCDVASQIDWTPLWKKEVRLRVASERAALSHRN